MNKSYRARAVVGLACGLISAAAPIGSLAGSVAAQEKYPSRPIELIVPWGAGGGADQLGRLVSKLMEPILGQGIPVLNAPGATGGTGMAKLLAAPADGYSLAVYIADTHALLAGKDARWKMEDITPAAVMIQGPSFIFVADNSPFKTWHDFEAAARANPGKLKVATLGFGSVDDFSLNVIGKKGIKVNQVPFSKPSERYVSILGGHADALYEQAGDVSSFISGKQMRPIMIFSEKRFAHFNDIPTSFELGFPVALTQFRAIVLRSGTPADRVKKVSDALAQIAATPEFKKFLHDQYGAENSFIEGSKTPQFLADQLEDMKKAMASN